MPESPFILPLPGRKPAAKAVLCLAASIILASNPVLAQGQYEPSQINTPYGQTTGIPSGPLPGGVRPPGVPPLPEPGPIAQPPIVAPLELPTGTTQDVPPLPAAPIRLPAPTIYGSDRAPQQGRPARQEGQPAEPTPPGQLPPVTLTEEPTGDAALLNTVLTGTVIKIQEYPINLETVLKLVESRNLLIERDILGSRIGKTVYYRTLSNLLPDINATHTQSRFDGTLQIFGDETLQVRQDRITPQINATWIIYPGGRTVFEALAARRRSQGTRFQLNQTVQQQMAAAAIDYYRMVESKVQVENVRIGIEEARSQVSLTEARLRAGVGTKLDVVRAQTQLAQQQRNMINAQTILAQAEQDLLSRLDLDPNIALNPTDLAAQPRVLVPMTWNTDQMVARAVAQNPTLKVSEAEIEALKQETRAVLSDIVPSVTLQAYRNRTGPEFNNLGPSTFGGFTIQTNLLENLGLQIPLDYKTRRLQLEQQRVQTRALVRDVQNRVIGAYINSRAFAQAIITARDELASAQEAYRLALGRFRAGLGITLDVLNAETDLTNARTGMVTSILGFNRSQISLLEAMGDVTMENVLNGLNASPPVVPVKPAAKALPIPQASPSGPAQSSPNASPNPSAAPVQPAP